MPNTFRPLENTTYTNILHEFADALEDVPVRVLLLVEVLVVHVVVVECFYRLARRCRGGRGRWRRRRARKYSGAKFVVLKDIFLHHLLKLLRLTRISLGFTAYNLRIDAFWTS